MKRTSNGPRRRGSSCTLSLAHGKRSTTCSILSRIRTGNWQGWLTQSRNLTMALARREESLIAAFSRKAVH